MTSATSELVTDSDTATVALAFAIASIASVADVVAARAAPRFRNRHAEQAVAGRGRDHVAREFARLVDAGRALGDDFARELLGGGLEGFLVGSEI
jgi:hypothetical protein